MLPYQRLRRHLIVRCDQRGEHVFGPAELRSGSPLGTHDRTIELRNQSSLLVYPKVFALSVPVVPSRVPVGERRTRHSLAVDPTRIVGVRLYQPGDPARHIDWRATARSTNLLVRVNEPATAPSVAVFLDLAPPPGSKIREAIDVVELTISVAASVVSELVAQGVPTGLYANGTVHGRSVALAPSSGAHVLPMLLDSLARVTGIGGSQIDTVLLRQRDQLHAGVSVVVASAHFAPPALAIVADMRRATTSLWIATDRGAPPPEQLFDARWEVRYGDDWRNRPFLDLTR